MMEDVAGSTGVAEKGGDSESCTALANLLARFSTQQLDSSSKSSEEEAKANMLSVATAARSGKGKENEPRLAAVSRRGILLSQEIRGQVLEVRFFKTVDQEHFCSLAIAA